MKKRNISALALAVVMTVALLCGCAQENPAAPAASDGSAQSEQPAAPAANDSEVVNLKIYTRVAEQADQQTVMDALNAYTKEKIGVTADWVFLGGSYADKIQVISASGEEYDAAYTSSWMNPYSQGVNKGAFVDLTDLLPEHAPELWETLPDYMWDATRVGGRIYAIPNQQIVARQMAAAVPTEILDAAEAAGVELPETVDGPKSLQALGVFAKENYGIKLGNVRDTDVVTWLGYEWVNDYLSCGAVRKNGETPTVVDMYETPEWLAHLHDLHDLNEAGLLDGQVAYDYEYYTSQRLGMKLSADYGIVNKPGCAEEESMNAGYPLSIIPATDPPYITTGTVIATMYGISSTSKHPVETLKYFNLLNTDPVAMNLICYGIEGTHYEKVSDTQARIIEDGGYAPASNWAFGNTFIAYGMEGQPADLSEQTAAINDSADRSAILGFTFNTDPVKAEIASVSKVVQEYSGLLSGELPVEETNAEFVAKLKIAGVDTVVAEMQRQIDEFMAAK